MNPDTPQRVDELPVIGRVINNYEIKSLIAEGGMGTVYLAEHPVIGRKVAVKILRRMYLEDKQMSARFINEARAAHAIHHPNIVEIIDVGYMPDGQPYLMMEFLSGETLAMRLARLGRLAPAEAVRVVDQAASALEAAHATGIIHRDLKPDNLFLIPEPGSAGAERVKVVDFGIAKLGGSMLAESIRTTGVVLGTPNYMSPEQCRGTGLDHRTDIYALGAILYEMLCGKPPFVSLAQIDVMMMHVVKVPTAPREIVPDIPVHLEKVVLRALAKKPNDRYPSMAALRAALASALPGSGPSIPIDEQTPESAVAVLSARISGLRRRRPVWVALGLALGLGAGVWGASRLFAGGRPTHSVAAPDRAADATKLAATPAPSPAPVVSAPAPPPPAVAPELPPIPQPAAEPPANPPSKPVAAAPSTPREARTAPAKTVRAKKTRRGSVVGVKDRPLPPTGSAAPSKPAPPPASNPPKEAAEGAGKNWMDKW